MYIKYGTVAFAMMVGMVGCGQAPSFVEHGQGVLSGDTEGGGGGAGPANNDGDGQSSDVVVGDDSSGGGGGPGNSQNPGGSNGRPGGGGSNPGAPGSGGNTTPVVFHNDPTNPNSPVFTVPGATPSEVDQIGKCLAKWGKVPFTGAITQVKRIKAAVSVYGIGVAVNDTAQTSTPALILVDAGVNVMGSTTYNMLNNNGYYCMKVNVNVQVNLDVNLACNAKLADNSVQVNVGSNTNSTTGMVGVNVGSTVHVDRQTPSGQVCSN